MLKSLSLILLVGGTVLLQSCGPRSLTRDEIKALESCAAEVKYDFYQARRKLNVEKAMEICADRVGVSLRDIENTDYNKVMYGEE